MCLSVCVLPIPSPAQQQDLDPTAGLRQGIEDAIAAADQDLAISGKGRFKNGSGRLHAEKAWFQMRLCPVCGAYKL